MKGPLTEGDIVEWTSSLDQPEFKPAAKAYGTIRSALEQKGRPIGPMDLLIAAHAFSLDVQLVTNNAKEFKRVDGLEIDNWA